MRSFQKTKQVKYANLHFDINSKWRFCIHKSMKSDMLITKGLWNLNLNLIVKTSRDSNAQSLTSMNSKWKFEFRKLQVFKSVRNYDLNLIFKNCKRYQSLTWVWYQMKIWIHKVTTRSVRNSKTWLQVYLKQKWKWNYFMHGSSANCLNRKCVIVTKSSGLQ